MDTGFWCDGGPERCALPGHGPIDKPTAAGEK